MSGWLVTGARGVLGRDPVRALTVRGEAARARAAPRPAYSVLGHGRWAAAGLAPLGHWRTALARALTAPASPRRPARAPLDPCSSRGP